MGPSFLNSKFDTETPNGYAKLLCLGDGRFTELQGDVWSPDSICPAETDRLLTFLYNVSKEGEGKTLVAWNLGFDTAALLKPWVHAHASSLRKGHYKAARLRKRIAEFERLGSERPPTPEECRQYQQLSIRRLLFPEFTLEPIRKLYRAIGPGHIHLAIPQPHREACGALG